MAKIKRKERTIASHLLTLTVILLAIVNLPVGVHAAGVLHTVSADKLPPTTRIARGKYIVQFSQPAIIAIKSGRSSESLSTLSSHIRSQHRTFTQYVEAQPEHFDGVKLDRTFANVINGISLSASPDQVAELTKAPGVTAIFPILLHSFDPIEITPNYDANASNDLSSSHLLTGVLRVRNELKLTGQGIRVAIIDTGIDYRHPAFARPGMECNKLGDPGCRVIGGSDIVGDNWDPSDPTIDILQPDDDPYDCSSGHGTHVAGIVGGNDVSFTGVAPEVEFLAYKIFGCVRDDSSTRTDAILAAMERAFTDGADVINMSIGGGASFSDYPTAQASTALAEAGVIVVSAHGNSGDQGLFWGGSPGQAVKGFATGSVDTVTIVSSTLSITGVDGLREVTITEDEKTKYLPDIPRLNQYPVKNSPNPPTSTTDGCESFPENLFQGHVALIRRGGCTFSEKVQHALDAGATAVLIYNNEPSVFTGSIKPHKSDIFVGYISGKDGEMIWSAVNDGLTVKVTDDNGCVVLPNTKTGGQPSDFTSWGPSPFLEIKPDIMAPGGNIWSAYPSQKKSYASLSGTSMASPYLAGASAIFRQFTNHHGQFDELQRRAQNTARPILMTVDSNLPWSVARQGAGLLNVYDLLSNKVEVTPSKLQLGDGYERKSTSIRIRNTGDTDVTYQVSHSPATSVYQSPGTVIPQNSPIVAHVSISTSTITVPAGRGVTIRVDITPSREIGDHWIQSGWIVFTPIDAKESTSILANTIILRVPYLIMTGQYESYPLLLSNSEDRPAIVGLSRSESDMTKTIGPFSVEGYDIPVVRLQITHVNRYLRIVLENARTNTRMGIIEKYEFITPGQYSLPIIDSDLNSHGVRPHYGWLGAYTKSAHPNAPIEWAEDGEYRFVVEMVRPGRSNDDWANRFAPYWTSPIIIIRRPQQFPTSTTMFDQCSTPSSETFTNEHDSLYLLQH